MGRHRADSEDKQHVGTQQRARGQQKAVGPQTSGGPRLTDSPQPKVGSGASETGLLRPRRDSRRKPQAGADQTTPAADTKAVTQPAAAPALTVNPGARQKNHEDRKSVV